MTDKKISQLANITGADLADSDEFVVARASTSENFSVTKAELYGSLPPVSLSYDDLIASTKYTYSAGSAYSVAAGNVITTTDSGTWEVAASGASDHHATTAGGVKLYEAGPSFSTRARAAAWIARGGTAADGTVISDGAVQYVASEGATTISDLPGFEVLGKATFLHFGAVADSDGTTGDGTDNTSAFQAAIDWAKSASPDGLACSIYLPSSHKYYRVTGAIDTTGATNPIRIYGAGRDASRIFADFLDPTVAVLDFSNDYGITNSVQGIGFLMRYSKNAPIALRAIGGTNCQYFDLAARGGQNSSFVFISQTNSYYRDIYARNGYQPLQRAMSSTTEGVSITAASTTLTADTGTPFSDAAAGDEVFINGAGQYARLKILHTKIASVTSSSEVELEDAATNTVSGAEWSFGSIRADYNATTNVLTFPRDVLDSDDEGRYVSIRGVIDRGADIGGKGALTGKIKSVTSASTCTLYRIDGAADFNTTSGVGDVTDQMVFFGPAICFYDDPDTSDAKNDDLNLLDSRIEDHDGPGLYIERGSSFRVSNTKIHGRAITRTGGETVHGKTPCNIYATNLRAEGLMLDRVILAWASSVYDGDGQIIVEASERSVSLDGVGTSSKVSGGKLISAQELPPGFYISMGDIFDSDETPTDPMGLFYVGARAGDDPRASLERARSRIVQHGVYASENPGVVPQVLGAPNQSPSYRSSRKTGKIFDSGDVFGVVPPMSVGLLYLWSSRINCYAAFYFRTSDNENGARLFSLSDIGSEVNVHGTNGVATLTGSTGTASKLNVSVDASSGQIWFENQVAGDLDLNFTIMA